MYKNNFFKYLFNIHQKKNNIKIKIQIFLIYFINKI